MLHHTPFYKQKPCSVSRAVSILKFCQFLKNQEGAFDTTSEISKLLKYSLKRETLFKTLKEELVPGTPGFLTLYPNNSWTVCAASLQSVIDKWKVFQELWDTFLETKIDNNIRGNILGVKHAMEIFDYLYGVNLGSLLVKHSDNVSCKIQY